MKSLKMKEMNENMEFKGIMEMKRNQDPCILLVAINAKYIHSNLAIHSLAASSGEYRKFVTPVEFTINMTKDQVLEGIYQKKPKVLCFSCYIWNISFVESVAREFHKIEPSVPIWVGGPEVSYEVEDFLARHVYVTGVMIGEGEDTFRELCRYYCDGTEMENKSTEKVFADDKSRGREQAGLLEISGIALRNEEGKVIFSKPRELADLSAIPFCYDEMEDYSNRIIYYESSRGCPFSCSYCLSSIDKKLRFRDLDLVKKELSFFLNQRVPQVKFVDRTFNCDHGHAMAIWKFLKENDNGVTNFHFEISADLLTKEELELLCSLRRGLVQLEIGVQTTNDATIMEIHRKMKLDLVKKNVAIIKKAGNINQHLDLIAGLPYEDFDSFRHSFDEIFALWSEQLQLGFLKVLKGSYMYEHAEEYGIVYREEPPYEVLSTKWLSYAEILRIKKVEEQLEFYYNSGQYEVTMKMLGCVVESPFDFFEALGDYYEEKGYRSMNHSRLRRCEILLEFLETEGFARTRKEIGQKEEDFMDVIRESLIYDLYERENCKTRPSWAPDYKTFRDVTQKYCQNGKLSHVEPFHYHFPAGKEAGPLFLPKRQTDPVWICFDYEKKEAREIYLLQ